MSDVEDVLAGSGSEMDAEEDISEVAEETVLSDDEDEQPMPPPPKKAKPAPAPAPAPALSHKSKAPRPAPAPEKKAAKPRPAPAAPAAAPARTKPATKKEPRAAKEGRASSSKPAPPESEEEEKEEEMRAPGGKHKGVDLVQEAFEERDAAVARAERRAKTPSDDENEEEEEEEDGEEAAVDTGRAEQQVYLRSTKSPSQWARVHLEEAAFASPIEFDPPVVNFREASSCQRKDRTQTYKRLCAEDQAAVFNNLVVLRVPNAQDEEDDDDDADPDRILLGLIVQVEPQAEEMEKFEEMQMRIGEPQFYNLIVLDGDARTHVYSKKSCPLPAGFRHVTIAKYESVVPLTKELPDVFELVSKRLVKKGASTATGKAPKQIGVNRKKKKTVHEDDVVREELGDMTDNEQPEQEEELRGLKWTRSANMQSYLTIPHLHRRGWRYHLSHSDRGIHVYRSPLN